MAIYKSKLEPVNAMNSIDTVRQINQIARNHYHKDDEVFDHKMYLQDCFTCLQDYFISEFPQKYLFSALTQKYEGTKRLIEVVKADEGNKGTGYHFADGTNILFEPTIAELLKDIESGICISLTRTLLRDKKKGKDLFFYSGDPYKYPVVKEADEKARIDFFRLSSLKIGPEASTFEDFLEASPDDGANNRESIGQFVYTLEMKEEAEQFSFEKVAKLLWYYKRMQVQYQDRHPEKDFIVHFIRPSFIDFDYNILLSLATNGHLHHDELSYIYLLVYRIVSQTAFEKTKEIERLRRKKSYSLTSHSFKTELSTTIVPQVKLVKKAIGDLDIQADSQVIRLADDLLEQSQELFRLTGLISLIDKVGEKDVFVKSGINDGLISRTREVEKISDYCLVYNLKHPNFNDIVISGEADFSVSIRIYDCYLSGVLIKLFYKTLFENLVLHAKRTSNQIPLTVTQRRNGWVFENATKSKTVTLDPTKLTGNLSLFQTLIEDTKSGSLIIDAKDYKFKVVYESEG